MKYCCSDGISGNSSLLFYLLFGFFSVSIHLKCLSEKGIVTRTDLAIWDKCVIKVREHINFMSIYNCE